MVYASPDRSHWCLIAVAALLGSCSGSDLQPVRASLQLLDFDTGAVELRVTADGAPQQGVTCHFRTVGATQGAYLEARTATTDHRGICSVDLKTKEQAEFEIIAEADGAGRVTIPVTVSPTAGGAIEALVLAPATATGLTAEVRLVEGFICAKLDAQRPPAPTADSQGSRQLVSVVEGNHGSVTLRGLKPDRSYTVVTVARSQDQVVAVHCHDGLSLTQERIDLRVPLALSVDLQWIWPDYQLAPLRLLTDLSAEVGLESLSALLRGVSGGTAPAGEVLDAMSKEGTETVQQIVQKYRSQLLEVLVGSEDLSLRRETLGEVADALDGVHRIELHTTMRLDEPMENVTGPTRVAAEHRFDFLAASINGTSEKAPLPSELLASTATPKLQDNAVFTIETPQRIAISSHRMSVPVADAILSKLLLDHFGEVRLAQVLLGMVDCSRAGAWVNSNVKPDGDHGISVERNTWAKVTQLCQGLIGGVAKSLADKVGRDFRGNEVNQQLELRGSASLRLLPSSGRIEQLVDGTWHAVGTFSARSQ